MHDRGLLHRLKRTASRIAKQHHGLRAIEAELRRSLEDGTVQALQRWTARYRKALVSHFELEEETIFPALHGLAAETRPTITALQEEHRAIASDLIDLDLSRLESLHYSAAAWLGQFRARLDDHERREERLVERVLTAHSAEPQLAPPSTRAAAGEDATRPGAVRLRADCGQKTL